MVGYDEFIVKARCFVSAKANDMKSLSNFNHFTIQLMDKKGFSSNEVDAVELTMGAKPVLALSFGLSVYKDEPHMTDRIRLRLGLKGRMELSTQMYLRRLGHTMDEAPYDVKFAYSFGVLDGNSGIFADVTSEPAILAKSRSLGASLDIEQSRYESILSHNLHFVESIVSGIPCRVIDAPHVVKRRELPPLITDSAFLRSLPEEVRVPLQQANDCFASGHYVPCAVMIRKAIELAMRKRFLQTGNEARLYNKEGEDLTYDKKLNILWSLLLG